jgi:flagellar FliL protein
MATKTEDAEKTESAEAKGGKKKLIIIIVPVVLLLVGAAVWFFVLRGGGAATAEAAGATPEPTVTHEPGAVVTLEPITINLAGGHYLKLGLSLQQPAGAAHEADGAQALDIAIAVLSGKSIDELATVEGRAHAKEELLTQIEEAYHHDVYDIYFTAFVMQ